MVPEWQVNQMVRLGGDGLAITAAPVMAEVAAQ